MRLILSPGRALLQRAGSRETLLDVAGPGPAAERLGDLLSHDAFKAGPIRVQVSDAWVRYDLIPLDTGNLSETDARQLAEAHYLRQFGTPLWPLRFAAHPGGLLVAGMAPELLDALEQAEKAGSLRLAGVEPIFSALLDSAETRLRHYTGWFLVDEGEVAVLAFIHQGRLASLRSQYCGAARMETLSDLLARQSALESRPQTAVLYHAPFGAPLTLPEPWQIERLVQPRPGLRAGLFGR